MLYFSRSPLLIYLFLLFKVENRIPLLGHTSIRVSPFSPKYDTRSGPSGGVLQNVSLLMQVVENIGRTVEDEVAMDTLLKPRLALVFSILAHVFFLAFASSQDLQILNAEKRVRFQSLISHDNLHFLIVRFEFLFRWRQFSSLHFSPLVDRTSVEIPIRR